MIGSERSSACARSSPRAPAGVGAERGYAPRNPRGLGVLGLEVHSIERFGPRPLWLSEVRVDVDTPTAAGPQPDHWRLRSLHRPARRSRCPGSAQWSPRCRRPSSAAAARSPGRSTPPRRSAVAASRGTTAAADSAPRGRPRRADRAGLELRASRRRPAPAPPRPGRPRPVHRRADPEGDHRAEHRPTSWRAGAERIDVILAGAIPVVTAPATQRPRRCDPPRDQQPKLSASPSTEIGERLDHVAVCTAAIAVSSV